MGRYFRRTSTGQWLARVDNRNPQPANAAHIAEVAVEYAISAADIELVESPTDPRDIPNMLLPPAPTPTPDQVEVSQLDALIQACENGTATAAQVRNLLGRTSRRLRNRGTL